MDRIHAETAKDGPTVPVGHAYEMWTEPWISRAVASGKLAESTAKEYRQVWRVHVSPRWASVPLSCVLPLDVQEWALTLTRSTARVSLVLLRKTFNLAATYVDLPRNPFGADYSYELPAEGPTRSKDVYSAAQMLQAWSVARGTVVEVPVILAGFAGCRTGESLGVKVGELERIERGANIFCALDVCRQMPSSGYEPLPDGQLKTPQSLRVVVVPPPMSERLLELEAERAAIGSQWLADDGDGLPLNRTRAGYFWRKACESAGFDRIPLSNFRPSWRTYMEMECSVSWDLLETLMGHALPGVSGKYYVRSARSQIIDAACEALPTTWDK